MALIILQQKLRNMMQLWSDFVDMQPSMAAGWGAED